MSQMTIITPCSRPENLPQVAESIQPGRAVFDLTWRVVLDGKRVNGVVAPGAVLMAASDEKSVYGNHQRNVGLDHTAGGWVYFLDDDNLAHPDFFRLFAGWLEHYPQARAFAFHQVLRKRTRLACPETMRVKKIDMAQVVICRDWIGAERFRLDLYEADGVFIEKLYQQQPDAWVFPGVAACYYNKLR